VLGALAEHWNDVRQTVGEARARNLADIVERLMAATSHPSRVQLRAELIDLLREWLDRDHPVRRAIRRDGDTDRSEVIDLDWDAAFTALNEVRSRVDEPDVLAAKQALLAEAHYSPQEVQALGADPGLPGLLRLPRPNDEAVLPAFQFTEQGPPHDVVITINGLLHADTDPWGAADWWLRDNAWLDDRPSQLIGVIPDELLIVAAQAVQGGD
jgi:hypothetical protein